MAPSAVLLNELSIESVEGRPPSSSSLDDFSALLADLRRLCPGSYLVSGVRLWGGGVNAYAALGPWTADAENRDKLRQILAMQNRAPYEAEFGTLEGDALDEYTFMGECCIGLGYAAARSLLAVSIPGRREFEYPYLSVEHSRLTGAALELAVEQESVRHAARKEHLLEHRDWLVLAESGIRATEVWDRRRERFEHLDFLARVEGEFLALEGRALSAVYEKLVEIQDAAASWNTAEDAEPPWRSKVTPESPSRIEAGKCTFRDDEGVLRDFSLHARFTPGAGRIHLELDRRRGRVVIAYIGPKRV